MGFSARPHPVKIMLRALAVPSIGATQTIINGPTYRIHMHPSHLVFTGRSMPPALTPFDRPAIAIALAARVPLWRQV
jgi:hypothetical protein